jgi:hypothetical protein
MPERPAPFQLYQQALDETKGQPHGKLTERYLELMREHGHLVPRQPGDDSPLFACGYDPRPGRRRDLAMAECRHGLTEQTCGFCSTPPMIDVPRTDLLGEHGDVIRARYPGTCPHCGDRIPVGMGIAQVEGVGWVCEDCLA